MNNKICSYCGSSNKVHKSSVDNKIYCQKHYLQMYKYGELRIDNERKIIKYDEHEKCKVDNCNCKILANGYCSKHYEQIRRHEKVLDRTVNDQNEIIEYDDYAEIVLYNRKCKEIARTKIDLGDVEKIKKYKWCTCTQGGLTYVMSRIDKKNTITLGNFLINKTGGILDYKDRDTLNNRKDNLRICDRSKNGINCGLKKNNTSGFTGVCYNPRNDNWFAQIKVNRKNIHLGSFKIKNEAINARIDAEIKYFGEYSPHYKKKVK